MEKPCYLCCTPGFSLQAPPPLLLLLLRWGYMRESERERRERLYVMRSESKRERYDENYIGRTRERETESA